ncbi:replicative protein [Cragig virus 1]|uniref:replicative protein n=1 Tax=Cragig virus 1 TaxID=2480172 RepID=UPI000F0CF7F9|nr:replicative protein [Cragig virus 1]AYN75541.1 replicative protein [Cragig virus 1]
MGVINLAGDLTPTILTILLLILFYFFSYNFVFTSAMEANFDNVVHLDNFDHVDYRFGSSHNETEETVRLYYVPLPHNDTHFVYIGEYYHTNATLFGLGVIFVTLVEILYLIFLGYAIMYPQSIPGKIVNHVFKVLFRHLLRIYRRLRSQDRLEAQSGSPSSFFNISRLSEIIHMMTHLYGFYRDAKQPFINRDFPALSFAIWRYCLVYYKPEELPSLLSILSESKVGVVDLQAQSGTARTMFNHWKDLSESELSVKMNRVLVGLMTCTLTKGFKVNFTEYGFKQFFQLHDPKIKFTTPYQLIMDFIEFTLTFSEVGYECFLDKSTRPLVVRDRAVRQWVVEYESLCHQLDERPINEKFDVVSIIDHMNSLLARGLILLKTHMSYLNTMYKDLSTKRSSLLREYNVASTRKPPFSVLIHGPPGIGKSSVTNLIGTIYHQVVKQDIYPDLEWDRMKNVYTYNPDDSYWSGYTGKQQWMIVLDDIGRTHRNLVARGLDTSIPKIITLVNSVGIATEQAALEDKGCIPLIPKVVVATTNVKDLNAGLAVAEKAAVLRRFPYVIRPYVKDQYLDKETGMMKKLDEVVHDAWEYQVEYVKQTVYDVPDKDCKVVVTYVPVPGSLPEGRMTGAELSMFLKEKIESHERNAAIMHDSLTNDGNLSMCEHGTLSHFACPKCVETQAWFFRKQTRKERLVKWFLKTGIDWCPMGLLAHSQRFFGSSVHIQLMVAKLKRRRFTPSFVNDALRMSLVTVCAALITHKLLSTLVRYLFPSLETQSNIWVGATENLFSVPSTSKSGNDQELRNTLAKSTFRLSVKCGDAKQEVSCFSLHSGWYVTVQHPFHGDKWQCVARYKTKKFGLDASNAFILTEKNLVRLDNDLVMFWCSSILPRKSLYDFLPDKIDTKGRSILVFDPRLDDFQKGNTTYYHKMKYVDDFGGLIQGTFMDGTKISSASLKGDCGALALSLTNKGYFISGMHCAGTAGGGPRAIFTQLSKDIFPDILPPLPMVHDGGIPKFLAGSKKSGKLGVSASKGVHQWCSGSALPLGSYPGRSTHSSYTEESIICKDVEESFNFTNPFTKPLMKAEQVEGIWKNPFVIATQQQATLPPFTPDEEIMEISEAFANDLFLEELLTDVGSVDQSIAVNGIPGDSYINRLPMSTSGGFYFPGAKRRYFAEVWIGEELFQTPDDELQQSINEIELCYLNGTRAYPVFQGSLKDEPISHKKREEGRTRVFTACGVAFAIVVRKQFLKIVKFFMKNNFITECAVSMNCYSKEWSKLYKHLTAFGDKRIVAGDYKSFDKEMSSCWIRAAFQILIDLRRSADQLSAKDHMICVGIATDISFPVTNMNGDLIQFFGGNSSGHPLTVIINSIVNSMYVRSAYKSIVQKPLKYFKIDVHLMTLGDDNILGSKLDAFNHTSIATHLRSRGITYTMADKDSVSVPFIDIKDADFLKRTFRELEGTIVAPLALKSIFKSLCMIVKKGNISDEEQLAQSYLAARREWSLHGEVVFNGCCAKMEKIFDKHEDVRRFFTQQHKYNFETTLHWVLGTQDCADAESSEGELVDTNGY